MLSIGWRWVYAWQALRCDTLHCEMSSSREIRIQASSLHPISHHARPPPAQRAHSRTCPLEIRAFQTRPQDAWTHAPRTNPHLTSKCPPGHPPTHLISNAPKIPITRIYTPQKTIIINNQLTSGASG